MPDERRVALPKEDPPWRPRESEVEDDMQPMLNLIEQEEILHKELVECAAETALIIEALLIGNPPCTAFSS